MLPGVFDILPVREDGVRHLAAGQQIDAAPQMVDHFQRQDDRRDVMDGLDQLQALGRRENVLAPRLVAIFLHDARQEQHRERAEQQPMFPALTAREARKEADHLYPARGRGG